MSVPLRHLNRLVSHQLCNRQEIDSRHRKSAGERMAQTVPRKVYQASFLNCRLKPMLVAMQLLPFDVNKNGTFAVQRSLPQHLESCERDRVQTDVTWLPTLSFWQADEIAREINSRPLQSVLLARSHSSVQRDLE